MKQNQKQNQKQKLHRPQIGIQCFAILWSIVTFFPLVFTLISSLKNTVQIYDNPFSLPEQFHLDNYSIAIKQGAILKAIGNSFFLAIVSVFVVMIVASMAAYVVTRNKGKTYNMIYTYLIAGLLIPVHCTFIPLVRMVSAIKGNNNYFVMILIYVTFNLPLAFFLISGYMRGISKELEEAAIIDGCGELRIYAQIIMPLTKPALATAGIMNFLGVYNDLIFATLFINKKELRTISLALNMFKTDYTVDLGPVFASIVLVIMPMVVIYLLFQDQIISGMAAGAVKG